ncbi:MAG: hypothetical protein ABI895_24180, partial [Deltaproteobacteria bacterium]
LLGYDKRLCAGAVSAFVSELLGCLRRRAERLLGLTSVSQAHPGAVAAIQRTDSALRLNVHVHVLALDGVYVRERAEGPLVFHALPTPSSAEVAEVARRTAERLGRAFKAQGRPSPWEESCVAAESDPEPLNLEQPGLFAWYEAAARGLSVSGERAGQPALRLVVGPFAREGESCGGFRPASSFERCAPGLLCDTPDFIADAPGICRAEECSSDADCSRTGCSGQLCAAESRITTCEFRPEYACYADPDITSCGCRGGLCGFDPTPELSQCLNDGGP